MDKTFTWTTPEQAARDEGRYWVSRSVEERVSMVETLRERTLGIYDETLARLERVFRFVEIAPRSLPGRGGPRRSG